MSDQNNDIGQTQDIPMDSVEHKKGVLKRMLHSFGQGFAAATVPGYSTGQSYTPDEAAYLVNPNDPGKAESTKQKLIEMFKGKPIPKDFAHMLGAYGKLHEGQINRDKNNSLTVGQAAFLLHPDGDPSKIQSTMASLSDQFPEGSLPIKVFHGLSAKISVGEKESQFDEKQWQEINKRTNPIVAPRGSLLGTAGQLNARASRALRTLDDPNITPQQISLAITDLAGIMQGGAPHEVSIKQQQYGNIWNDLANLKTRLTGKPSLAKQPEIVEKIKQIISDIMETDNQIIQDNLDIANQTFYQTINKDPERWDKYKQQVIKGTTMSNRKSTKKGSSNFDDLYRKHGLMQ